MDVVEPVKLGMALYREEVIAEHVRALAEKHTLNLTDLEPFHMHYYGKKIVDDMAKFLGLGAGDRVLDIGSGYSATSCILASDYGCQVTGYELQADIASVASTIIDKLGLSSLVSVCNENYLNTTSQQSFDHAVTLFSMIHIKNKEKLFANIFNHLKPGGVYYCEDYHRVHDWSDEEQHFMSEYFSCDHLQTLDETKQYLQAQGFVDITIEDITPSWSEYVAQRANDYAKNPKFDFLNAFFQRATEGFKNKLMNGMRLTAKKPS